MEKAQESCWELENSHLRCLCCEFYGLQPKNRRSHEVDILHSCDGKNEKKKAMHDRGGGKIGRFSPRSLLLCFHT